MADAGADIICAHLGFTEGGLLGIKKVKTLQASVEITNEIFERASSVNKEIIKVVYAGPAQTRFRCKIFI
jgi:predicted TIM-barrel enzyme